MEENKLAPRTEVEPNGYHSEGEEEIHPSRGCDVSFLETSSGQGYFEMTGWKAKRWERKGWRR